MGYNEAVMVSLSCSRAGSRLSRSFLRLFFRGFKGVSSASSDNRPSPANSICPERFARVTRGIISAHFVIEQEEICITRESSALCILCASNTLTFCSLEFGRKASAFLSLSFCLHYVCVVERMCVFARIYIVDVPPRK